MEKEEIKEMIREVMDELDRKDSIEIGNSKTGAVKVYFNAEDQEDARKRLGNAIELLKEKRKDVLGEY